MKTVALFTLLLAAPLGAGCSRAQVIPGTTVAQTDENVAILETVEAYRRRLMERNIEGLLVLASERYREDSGTPQPGDDYGYAGLRDILRTRLARVSSLRYDIQYRDVRARGNEVEVDVFINGAFELNTESDDRYHRISDHHRFVLERVGEKRWKFLSGM